MVYAASLALMTSSFRSLGQLFFGFCSPRFILYFSESSSATKYIASRHIAWWMVSVSLIENFSTVESRKKGRRLRLAVSSQLKFFRLSLTSQAANFFILSWVKGRNSSRLSSLQAAAKLCRTSHHCLRLGGGKAVECLPGDPCAALPFSHLLVRYTLPHPILVE